MSIDVWAPGAEPLNLANANFGYLTREVLGLDTDYCGDLDPAELLEAIARAERTLATGQASELERPTESGTGALGCSWIQPGLDADYLERRLADLKLVAQAARAAGVPVQYG